MSHITAAIENALSAGRWLDAAPLLTDLLTDGTPADLQSLEHYERTAGTECTEPKVRQILALRMRVVDNRTFCLRLAEGRRLQQVVREHGCPCRLLDGGRKLRVASIDVQPDGKGRWAISEIEARQATVAAYLGY